MGYIKIIITKRKLIEVIYSQITSLLRDKKLSKHGLLSCFFFICRNDEFRKKASISFGIQFDNDKYELLQTYLGEIFKHKDHVSIYLEVIE